MRTAAQRVAALIAMAAEENDAPPLALGKPIDTEHDLDALIDEWEEAHATSRQAPNPGRRDPRTADADEALRADPPGIPRRAVRHTGRRDAA